MLILIGGACQKLNNVPDKALGMIAIDEYSSKSILAHLITREVLALYQSRIAGEGLVFFHTSSKMLDVTSVVVSCLGTQALKDGKASAIIDE